MMDNRIMHVLVGKDGCVWGFYDSVSDAQEALSRQLDPEWYRVEEVWADRYFDLGTGKLINQKYVG